MVDRDLLKEISSSNIELILDALGVRYQIKSRRYWVICPFHNDNRIGSAYLIENGFFVCHSCGTKTDLFDFVMQIKNCSFKEASTFLCELFGGAERFGIDDKQSSSAKKWQKIRLSPAETAALNIPTDISLKSLYFYDSRVFKRVIRERAEKVLKEYEKLLKDITQKDAPKAYILYELTGSNSYYSKMNAEIKSRIILVEGIIERLA